MQSRKGVPSVVLFVLTGGVPISPKQTLEAAQKINKSCVRLMMVPVMGLGLEESDDDLTMMSKIASKPRSDNLVKKLMTSHHWEK